MAMMNAAELSFVDKIHPLVKAVVEQATSVQPESWLGTPYNEISPDDPLGIFLMFGGTAFVSNAVSGVLIAFMIVVIIVGNLFTLGWGDRIINVIVVNY